MKQSSKLIIDNFPMFEDFMKNYDSVILSEESLSELNNVEQTFLRLLWFFENPERENFNLECIYKNIDNEWLSLALECIVLFFTKDTYLINEPSFSLIKEDNEFYNQTDFVTYLENNKDKHGRNFSRPMLNTYVKRGDIPSPDLVVRDTKFWTKESMDDYLTSISK